MQIIILLLKRGLSAFCTGSRKADGTHVYKGTSLVKKRTPLEPYRRPTLYA